MVTSGKAHFLTSFVGCHVGCQITFDLASDKLSQLRVGLRLKKLKTMLMCNCFTFIYSKHKKYDIISKLINFPPKSIWMWYLLLITFKTSIPKCAIPVVEKLSVQFVFFISLDFQDFLPNLSILIRPIYSSSGPG